MDNGLVRQIVTLKYAVFAKEPGEIIIPILSFSAIEGGGRGILRSRGTRVNARTEQQTVRVLEPPQNKPSPWFPAENVTITSTWSADRSKMQTGTPITRTITITAHGQIAAAIPPLIRPDNPETLKSYKDKPQLDSKPTESGFVSTRIESEALVANKSGKIKVPEVKINWWNVKTKQWETVTLPAETLDVTGAAITNEDQVAVDQVTTSDASIDGNKNNWLWPLLCAVLALICLVQTIFIVILKRSINAKHTEPPKAKHASEKQHWQSLTQSLDTEDPKRIRQAILTWAQSALESEQTITLTIIGQSAESETLTNELKQLEESLYRNGENFDADSLRKPLEDLRTKALNRNAKPKNHAQLPPLYKS